MYGDCVNVASRIEAFAVPGAIFISEKVFDEVKNEKEIHVINFGKFILKNVKKPVTV